MSRLPAPVPLDYYRKGSGEMRPGYWMLRLVSGGPELPAMIAWCAHEPGNPDNILDTGPILIAAIADDACEPERVWYAVKRPISVGEYRYQIADYRWAFAHARHEPKVKPRQKIDHLTAPLPF